MSKLSEKINQDLKRAVMARDDLVKSVLRMLIAAVNNKEISLRPSLAPSFAKATADQKALAGEQGGRVELTDGQIAAVISSEIKKRRESILAYEQGRRRDLADQEASEIKILEKYLPAQLTDRELEKVIKEIIRASSEKDFGRIMGRAMAKVKGRAEGGQVKELVKKLLAG